MTKNAAELVREGKRLCFSQEHRDLPKGRELLRSAASLGRDDAQYFLGRTYEKEGDFDKAAECYEKGLAKRYRVAVYRLAILHGRNLLSYSDREYYLSAIKRLSKEGHHPSIAKYTVERLKGSYGVMGFLAGATLLIPNMLKAGYAHIKNPNDPLLDE